MLHTIAFQLTTPRVAIALLFAFKGFLLGSWVAHIPSIATNLDVTRSQLGSLLLVAAIGALVSFQIAPGRILAWGSARATRVFGTGFILTILGVAFAPTPLLFLIALFAFGFTNGAADVSLNAQAVEYQRLAGRQTLSVFHGFFSLGALLGTGLGGVFAATGVAPELRFPLVSALMLVAFHALIPRLIHEDRTAMVNGAARKRRGFVFPSRMLLPMGAIAFFCASMESAIADWGALHLQQDLGARPAVAVLGFTIFSFTGLIGRFGGAPVIAALGPVRVIQLGALIGAGGVLGGLAIGTTWSLLAGFGLLGLGFANMIALMFQEAGQAEGIPRGEAIASVATMCYVAFLVVPLFMGTIADALSLRAAFGLLTVIALAMLIVLAPRTTRKTPLHDGAPGGSVPAAPPGVVAS